VKYTYGLDWKEDLEEPESFEDEARVLKILLGLVVLAEKVRFVPPRFC
jgi:hypothetical protein